MRRPLTWLILALFGTGLSAVANACTDNEASLQDNDDGGTGGQAGDPGTSTTGIAPTGRTTGSGGGAVVDTGLGEDCVSDADCATGLTCRRSDRDSLGPGGPAHGLCTLACGVSDSAIDNDEVCQDFDENSLCFPFTADDQYCVQTCRYGAEANKCQGRVFDSMCRPVIHDIDGQTCATDAECGSGAGCYDLGNGLKCHSEPTVCLPQCNVDEDCPLGRFCDAGLGLCVTEEPTSKRFGESCDPDAEVDECAGFCNPMVGVCEEFCTVGVYPACNSQSTTNGDAACLLVPAAEVVLGDAGQCAKLCDCADDCFGGLDCLQLEDSQGPVEYLGRKGVCFTASPGDPVLNECSGGGGAGGQGGASGDE